MAEQYQLVPLPDGSFGRFPTSMPDSEINAIIAKSNLNPPPPGVIVHDTGRSYVTGGGPSVDTRGMDPGIGMEAERAQIAKGDNPFVGFLDKYMDKPGPAAPRVDPNMATNRNEAAAALDVRRQGIPEGAAALLPGMHWLRRPVAGQFEHGLTSGLADEAGSLGYGYGSAVRGKPFGESYNLAQEVQRQDAKQFSTDYPVTAGGLKVGGALTNLPGLAAFGLPNMVANRAVPLGQRMLTGGAGGAAYGTVEGAASGSGFYDRLKEGKIGALLGGVTGAAIPAIGAAARNVYQGLLDRSTVNRNLGDAGLGRPAGDTAMRVLNEDDAFSAATRTRLAADPASMLADSGNSSRSLLDYVISRGGGGSTLANKAVEERATASHRDLTDVFDRTMGPPQTIQDMTRSIRESGQPARSTAYEAAYAAPIDYSSQQGQELEALINRLRRPDGRADEVIEQANRMMRYRGEPLSAQIKATVAPDGTVSFERMPDVRQIDYITRGLRFLSKAQANTGALGAATDVSDTFSGLARDIRNKTRSLVGEYGTALDTAADDIGRVQATKLGGDMGKLTRGEFAEELRNHTDSAAEMQAVRHGWRTNIDDMMAKTHAAMTQPNQDAREVANLLTHYNSREMRDKMAMILDPVQLADVTNALDRATYALQLRASVAQNSKTYPRQAMEEGVNAAIGGGGVVGAFRSGEPLNVAKRVWQQVTGATPERDLAKTDKVHRQIAELMTSSRGQDAVVQRDLLQQAFQEAPQNARRAQTGGGTVALGAGAPAYSALQALLDRLAP